MANAGLTERVGLAEPTLYVVATPIGNLGDITLRALEVLKSVDVVAAEDTRVTQKLLSHHGIRAQLLALHEHNERKAAEQLTALLAKGQSVALVSDAGTPSISDPGSIAVAHVREAGYRIVPIPGASAVLAAIAASGLQALPLNFHGFLPSRKSEREKMLGALKSRSGLQAFYEAPHRIVESVESIASTLGGQRRIVIARELT
jgi:16S rRNA (cytidine1402-2'-O)-methyltransferase